MTQLSKVRFKMARRIWRVQRNHPRTRFVAKDFTNSGKLTKSGLKKTR